MRKRKKKVRLLFKNKLIVLMIVFLVVLSGVVFAADESYTEKEANADAVNIKRWLNFWTPDGERIVNLLKDRNADQIELIKSEYKKITLNDDLEKKIQEAQRMNENYKKDSLSLLAQQVKETTSPSGSGNIMYLNYETKVDLSTGAILKLTVNGWIETNEIITDFTKLDSYSSYQQAKDAGIVKDKTDTQTQQQKSYDIDKIIKGWDGYNEETKLEEWNRLNVDDKKKLWNEKIEKESDKKLLAEDHMESVKIKGVNIYEYGVQRHTAGKMEKIFNDLEYDHVDENGIIYFTSTKYGYEYHDENKNTYTLIAYDPDQASIFVVEKDLNLGVMERDSLDTSRLDEKYVARINYLVVDNDGKFFLLKPKIISHFDDETVGDVWGGIIPGHQFNQKIQESYDGIKNKITEKEGELYETTALRDGVTEEDMKKVYQKEIDRINNEINDLKKASDNFKLGKIGGAEEVDASIKEIGSQLDEKRKNLKGIEDATSIEDMEKKAEKLKTEINELEAQEKDAIARKDLIGITPELVEGEEGDKQKDEGTPIKEVEQTQSAITFYENQANQGKLKDFKEILKGLGYPDEEILKMGEGKKGVSIEAIQKAQEWLKDRGYDVGTTGADGKVGTDTIDAVEKAKERGLKYEEKVEVSSQEVTVIAPAPTTQKNVLDTLEKNSKDVENWFKEGNIKDNADNIAALGNLLGIDSKEYKDPSKYIAAIKEAYDKKNFIRPQNVGGKWYYKTNEADQVIGDGNNPLLVYGSEVYDPNYDENNGKVGSFDKEYSVLTLENVPQTEKGVGFYVSEGNLLFKVNVEGEGKNKYYTLTNPTSVGIKKGDVDGKVYLMRNNQLYYKDPDGDEIYSHTLLKDDEGNAIKSLTPIEPLQGGMRYTQKIDNKNKQIVIILDGKKQTFESSSGVAYNGFEYLEKDGKVYIWNDVLKSYVDEKGKPVTDLEKAATSDQFAKTLTSWGLFLDKATYITSGYRGFSLFYDEPDVYGLLDENMQNWLGGIDGWTSLICQSKITNSLDQGIAMSSTSSGASAHIEAEKIKVINYTNEGEKTEYLYKLSLEVNPGPKIGGCDMNFKVYIEEPRRSVFKNSKTGLAYTFKLTKGNESASYKGPNMIFKKSKTDYEKVCIHFSKLEGHCLAGISEGEELCNNIIDGGEKSIDLGDDPCEEFPLMMNCWQGERDEETSTATSTSESGEALGGEW